MRADDLAPGSVVAERFEIERVAGAGGMGTVFRARDRRSGAQVALKVMHVAGLEEARRFAREASMLAELAHPAIVRHVASGATHDGRPFLAMEWLEGEDLEARLSSGAMTPAQSIALVTRVAQALAFVHARGAVHRDVKPSNVFLEGGSVDRAKLLDFGIARREPGATRAVTRTGHILGTPGYMAPEQLASAKSIDARADVFALGCVLFECLTGRPAFYAERVLDLLAMVALQEAPRLCDLVPDASAELEALLAAMLAKRPESRPADGTAVMNALAALAPASAPARLARRVGDLERRRAYVVAAAIDMPTQRASAAVTLGDHEPSDPSGPAGSLASLAASLGAELTPLSGAVALVFAGSGAAVDLATRAAHGALALRGLVSEAPVVAVTGYLLANHRLVAGEVLDRARDALRTLARSRDPAGAIRLDPAMSALLEGRFEVEGGVLGAALGEERPRRVAGRAAPWVGRSREIAAVEATWDECVEDRVARVVLAMAPSGLGKTRLAQEVVARVRARAPSASVWTTRGDPRRAGEPFALLSALRSGPADASQEAELERWLVDRVGSSGDPTLIVVDDLQWADVPSVRALDGLLSRGRGPLLLLATGRPALRETFGRLWLDRSPTGVSLSELSDAPAEALVRGLLGNDDDETVAAIVREGGGNPFILEELCRARTETSSSQVPDAAIAALQARLEGLSPGTRRTLRAASALGPVFWRAGLTRILGGADSTSDVDDALEELVERRIVRWSSRESFLPGEQELVFSHPLLPRAVFDTLTDADKALGRELADEWVAGCDPTPLTAGALRPQ